MKERPLCGRKTGTIMKKPVKKRTTSTRKDHYTFIAILVMIGALIFRIPLGYVIGDKGLACFGTANEIYVVIAGMVSCGLSEAVSVLIKYRVKREQYKSAQKVLSGALLTGGLLGFILSAFFGIFGHFAAENIMHIPLAGMALTLMAPSMFFIILTGVFRGYFQGNGTKIPTMHSMVLHLLFLFAGGLSGASLLYRYGLKVSALLQNEDYSSAYGAMGASIGFLTASVLCFFHSLILYFVYRNSARRQMGRELQKSQDTGFHIFSMLIGAGAIYSLLWFCFNGLSLTDQFLVFLIDGSGADVADWGAYYGKCLVITGIITGLITMICLGAVRRITGFAEREEHRIARDRLGILIHQCAVITIPAAVFLAVLSENFLELLFSGTDAQTTMWVQIGSIGIVLAVFALVFTEILIRSRKIKYAALIGAGAFLIHTGLLVLLLKTAKTGIVAVLISTIVFYGAVAVAGFLLISRSFQYTQEWIRSFAVPLAASAISGVIAMLINRALSGVIGKTASMLVCILVAAVCYMILLLVTRSLREEEMEEMPGGRFLLLIAGILRLS